MDQACLYVSDFGFSFLAIGGTEGILSVSESGLSLRVRIFGFAIVCGRVGGGRRGRERCGDLILEFEMAGDSVG